MVGGVDVVRLGRIALPNGHVDAMFRPVTYRHEVPSVSGVRAPG
jgi:hypothetical protein